MRLVSLLLTVVLVISCAQKSNDLTPGKIRVLLDTDANNELDDQHAIAYLLLNGDVFTTDGITVNTTHNGGNIEEQAAEAERVVKLCNLFPKIPVYRGADGSFEEIKNQIDQENFDGADAVNYIIKKAKEPAEEKLVLLPVGKLTNIALALQKEPSIAENVRIVWLGSNYPEPGEYNQDNDEAALNYILDTTVHFEIALVRGGQPSGTAAVRVTPEEIATIAGKGPKSAEPVIGRHGGEFYTFGDYSNNLFEHIHLYGDPPARSLFDMAAVAIVKNPEWATPRDIPAPILVDGQWQDRPDNPRTITIWENFDRDAIIADLYRTLDNYVLVK